MHVRTDIQRPYSYRAGKPAAHTRFPPLGREGMSLKLVYRLQSSHCVLYPQYLGRIPDVSDWQSPASRSEFMQMVDEGQVHGQMENLLSSSTLVYMPPCLQMQGHLMWHSLTPKMIHVNQRWLVITDDKKVLFSAPHTCNISVLMINIDHRHTTQSLHSTFSLFPTHTPHYPPSIPFSPPPLSVILLPPSLPPSLPPYPPPSLPPSVSLQVMYAEFLVASIGSLAYAEDDGRHILGIKVARSPSSVRGGMVAEDEEINCHVLECENEV